MDTSAEGTLIMKNRYPALILILTTFVASAVAQSGLAAVPEPFQGYDPASTYTIKYDDVDTLLKAAVVDVGRSTRELAAPTQAKTGTRMKVNVKRSTINEGNRFVYEAFENEEKNRSMLSNMRSSLEEVPAIVPLKFFSRNEQLAYWLNLYNITLLDEIVAIYPKRNLKKSLVGKKSILDKKLLTVAGVPLSLNDIQFTILRSNYDNNPLIMYGLYQGIIGGPNIRKTAYKGDNVYRLLEHNAREFVNSNRGTYTENEKVFRVSSLYERNKAYFPNYDVDLRAHLLQFLEGEERTSLQSASKIKPDIDDWTVTDLYGSYQEIGGSFADNNAALLDSIQSSFVNDNKLVSGNLSAASSQVQARAPALQRFSPQLIEYLAEIRLKEEATYMTKGKVTVEELGEAVPATPAKEDQ